MSTSAKRLQRSQPLVGSRDLRALRLRRRLRQRDVAAAVGITDHELRKWERGLVLPPKAPLEALAQFYGVSSTELKRAQIFYAASVAPGEGYTTSPAHHSGIQHPGVDSPAAGLRVLDLFCGAGGLTFGLELSGHFKTVAGLDLLPDRVATLRANHPHAIGLVGDIRTFSIDDLSHVLDGIDAVVGGPPCQGFSSIRPFRTLTVGDKRNTLIEQFLMWVSAVKPRWFLFENVVGVLTHHQGKLLRSLLDGFDACGYSVSWRVVNASLYGVPQNRERLIIVGNRTGAQFQWPMPLYRNDYKSMAGSRREVIRTPPLFSQDLPEALTLDEAIGDLPEIAAGESANLYALAPQNEFQRWARRGAAKLLMHEATRHSSHMLDVIAHAGANISCIPAGMVKSGYSSSYSRLDPNKPSTTLTVNFVHPASNRCIHPYQHRALTPREGARIQSFPDGFRFCGTRAQIVKQIGNAVPPLLARVLGESIALADSKTTASRASARASRLLASEAL